MNTPKNIGSALSALLSATVLSWSPAALAEVSDETLRSLSAPDKLETRAGTLEFKDGAPTAETAKTVYDTIDFVRALNPTFATGGGVFV